MNLKELYKILGLKLYLKHYTIIRLFDYTIILLYIILI